ncbi:MAG: DUF4837 family protein, partial [Longimicrobiales bacterium]|nr:DUF4837 family protein [Longimicrobiales bacterium]
GAMTLLKRALPLALLAVAACDGSSRLAMGEVNSIIVVAEDSLWSQVSDTVLTTLQPRIFAVRDEPTFQLTHTVPGSEHWGDLQRFRQILAIGRPDDPWVRPALEAADTMVTPPALVEVNRVWARNQRVTALVVAEDGSVEWLRGMADSLASLLDRRYRTWAQNRMYVSGHDTALVDTLRREGGFTLDMPVVYRWRQLNDSTFVFLNDNPDASQLVRWLTVTWRTELASEPSAESVLAWRDSIASSLYDWGQRTERDRLRVDTLAAPGAGALEVRGVWSGLDEFPQAGPFIARAVDCPGLDRRYLLDAWLYAPARDKYQYMIQLETLLDSFRCASGSGT